ncbi:hypothetical protein [Rhodoblastus sp.]|uniref:hypothetical protein n=1 Tax=Rhodoblastus sp. TaxID=1962975 RepID=UPI0035AED66D
MGLDIVRLGKLLSLAGSQNESEAIVALRKMREHLDSEGLTFTDLGQRLIGQAPRAQNARAKEPEAAIFTDESGVKWPSRDSYDKHQAAVAARRETEWRQTEDEREEIIARYGSREAGLARNPREQLLHDAVADFLKPLTPDLDPPGRWHASLDGWDRGSFGPPSGRVVTRIEQAFALPTTLREAKEEFDAWKTRSHELEMLMGRPDDSQLDLPAFYRAQRVQALYEHELPIRSIDDLHLRLQFTVDPEWSDDTGRALPEIVQAFEALVVSPAGAED